MDHLEEVIREYYAKFESYGAVKWEIMPFLVFSTLVFSGMMVTIFYMSLSIDNQSTLREITAWVAGISTLMIFLVASIDKMRSIKEEAIFLELGTPTPYSRSLLNEAKKSWLSDKTGFKPNKFFELAMEYRSLFDLHQKTATPHTNPYMRTINHIYDPDSKPRVTAQLLALFSLATLITLKSASDTSYALSLLESRNLAIFLFLVVTVSMLIFLSSASIHTLLSVIRETIAKFVFSGKWFNSSSERKLKILINDLVKLHEPIPKQNADMCPPSPMIYCSKRNKLRNLNSHLKKMRN